MGRHSADAGRSTSDAEPDRDPAHLPPRILGPVTDPLLLDAVQEQLRREREEREDPGSSPPHSLADLQRAWQPYRRPPEGATAPVAERTEDAEPGHHPDAVDDPPADAEPRTVGAAPALLDVAPPPRSAVSASSSPPSEDSAPPAVAEGPPAEPVGLSVPMAVIVVAVGVAAAIALSVLAVVPH